MIALTTTAERQAGAVGEWGVLSDMDGTLLDTEGTWRGVIERFLSDHGGEADSVLATATEGIDLRGAAELLAEGLSLRTTPAEVAAELDRRSLVAYERNVMWREGAQDLVRELSAAGVPLALVTSSPRHWVEAFAREVDLSPFTIQITADDTESPKPFPDPYRLAARQLGVPVTRCVVLEDSPVGVASAVAAGCRVIVVNASRGPSTSHPFAVRSLTELNVRTLREIARGREDRP